MAPWRRRRLIEIYARIYFFVRKDNEATSSMDSMFKLVKENNIYFWKEVESGGVTCQFALKRNKILAFEVWFNTYLTFDFNQSDLEPKNAIQEK